MFEGLAIYDLVEKWESFPVIRFDLTSISAESSTKLENYLQRALMDIAQRYDLNIDFGLGIGGAFEFLVKDIARKEGKKVVILIDEYGKGITEMLDNEEQLEQNQRVLRPFFSVIKSQSYNIHFCFITELLVLDIIHFFLM